MKRPLAFVVIIWWLGIFLVAMSAPTARLLTGYRGPVSEASDIFRIVEVLYVALVAYFLAGLLNLRAAFIWFAVALSGLWAVWLAVRVPWLAVTNPLVGSIIIGAISALLCGASAVYLARSEIRDFASRFRADSDRAARQRDMDRAIRKTASR